MRGYFFFLGSVVFSMFASACSSGDFAVGATTEDSSSVADGELDGNGSDGSTTDTGNLPDALPPDDATVDSTLPPDSSSDTHVDSNPGVDAITSDAVMPGGCTANSDCGTGSWCYKTGCGPDGGKGTCGPMPSGLSDYGPVCACDGITYWNAFHAATFGATVRTNGVCGPLLRKTCNAPGACDGFTNSECVFEGSDASECMTMMPTGFCWRTPSGKICPVGKSGPTVMTCDSLCQTECDAVKNKKTFYPSSCVTSSGP